MKKLTALLLSVLLVLSLAACGGDAGPNTPDTSANAAPQSEAPAEKTAETDGKSEAPEAAADEVSEESVPADKDTENVQAPDEITELAQKYAGLTEDELTWEYDSAAKTIVISGKGPMKDYAQLAPEWEVYSAEAEKVLIGDEVTSVGSGAFLWFTALTEVQLGAAVEYIGASAFSNCYSLYTVNFPATLKYVGAYAFNNCILHSESGFAFPEGMLYLGTGAFNSAFKENTVSIPASLAVIEDGAFANIFVSAFLVDENNPGYASVDGVLYDKSITTLINYPADKRDTEFEIPGTVTTIRADAVAVTNTLGKIVIPASVTSIAEGAIYWNYALKSIEVAGENGSYQTTDGVLFTKDGKSLLAYPIASELTEYTVPEGTERICNYAMSQANALTEIHASEGLREIGDTALYFCAKLTGIHLPESLTVIEAKALTFCDALTEIQYAGASADWEKVNIGEENELLTDGRVQILCAK